MTDNRRPNRPFNHLTKPAVLLATWFASGLLPKAPGTWGSLAALPFAWGLHLTTGWIGLSVASVCLFVIGAWASMGYLRRFGGDDPGPVVIDEVTGQWLTLVPAAVLAPFAPDPVVYAAAFVLFRLADILKPWPVSWADRKISGALGVMVDDVLAAVYSAAALILFILYARPLIDVL